VTHAVPAVLDLGRIETRAVRRPGATSRGGTKVPYRLPANSRSVPHVSDAPPFIAVVDDEPPVLKALERLLRAAKFEVATFGSGAEFLSSLATRAPDCVVLDLQMPGMNGFEVQTRLAAEPTVRVPVVIITAHDSPLSQQRAMAGGAWAYLRKPVDAQPLLDAIRAAVARKTP
jgi:FixJ family two-component response regulator